MSPARPTLLLSLSCFAFATGVGSVFLFQVAAPPRLIALHLISFLVGMVLLAVVRPGRWSGRCLDLVQPVIGVLLLAVGIWGTSVYGATRWGSVAGMVFQPSMILLPFSVVLFTRRQSPSTACGAMLMAIAMAIQPDRSMAGILAASLLVLSAVQPSRWTILPLATAFAAFAVTLLRPDRVPPAPFVEGVFRTAFATSGLLGGAVLAGAFALLVPGVLGVLRSAGHRGICIGFVIVWVGLFVFAYWGNYPTPVLGYGSSGMLAYALSVAALPRPKEL